ncbi:2559_t:CDS:1, partial [Dentiscutata heterogama]
VLVFGSVKRTTGRRIFIKVISNRSTATLLTAIEKYISSRSIMFLDIWHSYSGINS